VINWKLNYIAQLQAFKVNSDIEFIHTPKCAGSFVKKVCNDLGVPKIDGHNHPKSDRKISFTIIRHPVERYQSLLYYRLSGLFPKGGSNWPSHLIDIFENELLGLDDILERMSDEEILGFHPYNTLSYWAKNADILLTINELGDFLRLFGYEFSEDDYRGRLNVSTKLRSPLGKNSIERLERLYSDDIKLFEQWTGDTTPLEITRKALASKTTDSQSIEIPLTVSPFVACIKIADYIGVTRPTTPKKAMYFLEKFALDTGLESKYTRVDGIPVYQFEESKLKVPPQNDLAGSYTQSWGAINYERCRKIPSASVFAVENAVVVTIAGTPFVFDEYGHMVNPALTKYSLLMDLYSIDIASVIRFAEKSKIETAAIIECDVKSSNYCHWVCDKLSKIGLFKAYDNTIVDYLVTNYDYEHQKNYGALLHTRGININVLPHTGATKYKTLYISDTAGEHLKHPANQASPWAIEFFRNLASDQKRSEENKLYISRGDVKYRRVLGEKELISKLEKIGFREASLSGMPISEQIKLFSTAEVVVAPHGAGLTNIVYMNEGASVVEITGDRHGMSSYRQICEGGRINYASYSAKNDIEVNPPVYSNINFDIDDFVNSLSAEYSG